MRASGGSGLARDHVGNRVADRFADLLRGLGADLLELGLAGVEAFLRGLARRAGDPPAGLAEQLLLALGLRQQGGDQRSERETADHRGDRIDAHLLGGLAGDRAGALARRLIGGRGPLARRLEHLGGPCPRPRLAALIVRSHQFTPSVTLNSASSVSLPSPFPETSRVTARFSGARARKRAKAPSASDTALGRLFTACSAPSAMSAPLSLTPSQASSARLPGLRRCWAAA